jgi:crossover junction endodeoxyribonuclease RuvC
MIAGLDIGLRNLGFAIFNENSELLDFGCLKTCAGTEDCYRIAYILKELGALFNKYNIESVGLERVFLGINPSSCLRLAQLKGAIMAFGIARDIDVVEYHPTQIKHAILSQKKISKEDINKQIRLMYPQFNKKNANISDAIAIGFYHLNQWLPTKAPKSI